MYLILKSKIKKWPGSGTIINKHPSFEHNLKQQNVQVTTVKQGKPRVQLFPKMVATHMS